MNNEDLKTYSRPDTLEDIKNTDLVQLSRQLLDAAVVSTNALSTKSELSEQHLKELRLVLGFLNATNNVIKTKIQYFKMVGVSDKIEAIKKVVGKE